MLNVGEKAPDFKMKDQNGKEVRLSDFIGKKSVVLYFYPKDDTPGCTREACNFRDQIGTFENLDAEILGVSVDGETSHQKFANKYNLTFSLLSDNTKETAKKYGALKETGSAARMTFVIDKGGTIQKIFPAVKVDGHWEEVRETLENLTAKSKN